MELGWACAQPGVACSPVCGDGLLRQAETCDDGDLSGNDGCSASCRIEPGWACAGEPTLCTIPSVELVSGHDHNCALLDNGAVKCWGYNDFGQLGQGDLFRRGDQRGEMHDDLLAIDLGTGRTAVSLAAGENHTCALLDNGAIKCWGENSSGQLGQEDRTQRGDDFGEMGDNLPVVDLGTGRTALSLVTGRDHTCARLDNDTVKCWGENSSGQLGLGHTLDRGDGFGEMGNDLPAVSLGTGRTALSLSAGRSHTCALLDNGTVKCWGSGSSGQLGLGDNISRGNASGEMGDDLPAVALGTGRTAVSLVTGNNHTCALLDNGDLKCWGANSSGQLGLEHAVSRGNGPGEMGDNLPAVDLGTGRTAVSIAAGGTHTCVRLDNAQVKCWGHNGSGQLGLGHRIRPRRRLPRDGRFSAGSVFGCGPHSSVLVNWPRSYLRAPEQWRHQMLGI